MKSNWSKIKLGDVAKIQGGYPFKSSDFIDSGNIVLKIKNVQKGKINLDDCGYVNDNIAEISKEYLLENDDVLICMTGSSPNAPASVVGRVALFNKNKYGNCLINQRIGRFLINEKIANKKFIYYVFYQDKTLKWLVGNSSGSANQANISNKTIENYEFELPSLLEQNKIVNILANIDDKIELNNSLNNNLEQQAQAIFNNKFVNIESIPNNWETSNLSTIADYLNGLAMQKFRPNNDEIGIPVLKIKELRQGFCDNQSDLCSPNIKSEYLINDGDVIFSWSGTLWLDLWCSGFWGLNQHLFKVTSSKYDKWFYYFWTKYHLNKFIAIAADKATTMGHIKREDLDKSEVLIPDDETYTQLTSLLSPILELIIKNKVENRQLIQLRDTLLPKLMSGEIDVSNVDISTDKLSFSEK